VHRRTHVALLVVALACVFPARAAADPMPPGDYTITLTSGVVTFGSLLPVGVPALPSVDVPLADQPVTSPLPLPISFDVTLLGSLTTSTTLLDGQGTVDPATGRISIDVTFWTTITAVPGPFLNITGTCTYGSPASPLALHLQTPLGSEWNASTLAFTLRDDTFGVPTPSCNDATLFSLLANGAGDTSPGHNSAVMVGTAARPEDGIPAPPPPPNPGTGSGTGSGGSGTTGGDQSGSGTSGGDQTANGVPGQTVTRCVVPKLRGRKLAGAKRALRRAHCRLGHVSRRRSKKPVGTVLHQGRRAGTKLPRGTRIAITVAAHRA
jgi:hypothetical protein